MKEEKWKIEDIKDPNYQILYRVTNGPNIIFIGIENDIERVSLHCSANMTTDAQGSYKLTFNKYDFWYGLKINLMLMGINTIALPNIEKPQIIDLFKWIYFDGFTRDNFINSIIKVIDGMGLCRYMWEQFANSQWNEVSKGKDT